MPDEDQVQKNEALEQVEREDQETAFADDAFANNVQEGPEGEGLRDLLQQVLSREAMSGRIMEPKDGSVRIHRQLKQDFTALTSGRYDNFTLIAGFVNGRPAAFIGTFEDTGDQMSINPLFTVLQPDDLVKFRPGDEGSKMEFPKGPGAITVDRLTEDNAKDYALTQDGDAMEIGDAQYKAETMVEEAEDGGSNEIDGGTDETDGGTDYADSVEAGVKTGLASATTDEDRSNYDDHGHLADVANSGSPPTLEARKGLIGEGSGDHGHLTEVETEPPVTKAGMDALRETRDNQSAVGENSKAATEE